jgi:hypothetical protein
MTLSDWQGIKNKFKDNILLGNGASIAIHDRLSYRSLYERVCDNQRLNRELLDIFTRFETSNFEFILKLLLEASQINEILNIPEDKTRRYYYELRDALINTVWEIHPTYENVESLLPPIADFLSNFKTVMSLNYDLMVYWAMLFGNEQWGCNWFKDCYIHGEFERDFEYLSKPQDGVGGATLVFYPHGNLFLATDIYNNEVKLCRTDDDRLLETVLAKWKEKDYVPLFVSEGSSTEKFHAVTRSEYLNVVYDSVLSKISGTLLIYGWSMSMQDEHIFKALDHRGITDIAVSVYTTNSDWEANCFRIQERFRNTHKLKDTNLYFFDSNSEGCWIY